MGFVTKFLKQKAVYWGSPTPSGYGAYTFAAGIEINVRWEDKQVKFVNNKNIEVLSSSVIMLDVDIEVGGMLYLGELTDLSSSQILNPLLVSGSYEIGRYDKVPNLNVTDYVRTAWLTNRR